MKSGWLALLLFAVPACSTFKPKLMPDGSYRLQCASTLGQCEHRARLWCDDEELYIVKKSDDEVFGVEGHQTGAEGALIIFRCGRPSGEGSWELKRHRPKPVAASAAPSAAPPSAAASASPSPATSVPPPASPSPAASAALPAAGSVAPAPAASTTPAVPPLPAGGSRLCVPGVTQRCYGPGACAGAQACLPDGSGFGPCDCGSKVPDANGSSAGASPPPKSDGGGAGAVERSK